MQTAMTEKDPFVVNGVKEKLGIVGNTLPHGTVSLVNGGLNKSFATRTWNLKMEKRLGKLRDKHKNGNAAIHGSVLLATLCEQIGDLKFEGDDKDINRAIVDVGRLSMGDVLFMIVALRREVIGDELEFKVKCPNRGCEFQDIMVVNIADLDVTSVKSAGDAAWVYDLVKPIKIRGHEVKRLIMSPPLWGSIANHRGANSLFDTGEAKSTIIYSSISRVEGVDNIALSEPEIEDMSKRDIELLSVKIQKNMIGPDMSVEIECPKCEFKMSRLIDWTYDAFFQASSR